MKQTDYYEIDCGFIRIDHITSVTKTVINQNSESQIIQTRISTIDGREFFTSKEPKKVLQELLDAHLIAFFNK